MNSTSKKPRKTSSSSEQLAACSLISGIAGIICSFFYLPFSLVSGKNTPMGLICGVIGIVLAIMAKNADIRPGKKYPGKALAAFLRDSPPGPSSASPLPWDTASVTAEKLL